MLRILMNEGKREGPTICDEDGYLLKSAQINLEFRQQLAIVQNFRPDLIKETINVFDIYNIRRSLKRRSTSIAMREKVPQPVIDLVNRWSIRENSRDRSRGSSMRDYYTEIKLVLHTILPYSEAL